MSVERDLQLARRTAELFTEPRHRGVVGGYAEEFVQFSDPECLVGCWLKAFTMAR
ncbi:hypothetical protein [Streptomyces sp. NBC_00459]|uniref:hypothetical protein n=1 Tax=Streptomyces sp. NBC_00459 TaxID=2975749 RepID=UPI002E19090C